MGLQAAGPPPLLALTGRRRRRRIEILPFLPSNSFQHETASPSLAAQRLGSCGGAARLGLSRRRHLGWDPVSQSPGPTCCGCLTPSPTIMTAAAVTTVATVTTTVTTERGIYSDGGREDLPLDRKRWRRTLSCSPSLSPSILSSSVFLHIVYIHNWVQHVGYTRLQAKYFVFCLPSSLLQSPSAIHPAYQIRWVSSRPLHIAGY